jgi:hypothetical protein
MLRLTAAEARKMGLVVNKKTGRAKIKRKRPESVVKLVNGRLTVVIYDVPPSLNDWHGVHWAAKVEAKRQWEDLLKVLLRGKAMFRQPVVRITYGFNVDRARDKDNMTPKWIMDGLVKSKVIADDNSKAVDVDWSISPDVGEWCKTEIVIREKSLNVHM